MGNDGAPSPQEHLGALGVGKLPTRLLSRLIKSYAADHNDDDVLVGPGIGRDAAAVQVGDHVIVMKSDPITFATESAARYLVNVNANDLACLGATPRWLMVTALLPETTTDADVESQFRELSIVCRELSIALIGGHTEITRGLDRPILVGFLVGIADRASVLKPGQAGPGDILLLTKGIAIEGSALLARERWDQLEPIVGRDVLGRAARFLIDPGISVVADAKAALSVPGVTALHDPTEGGLAMGVRELAIAAGRGARLDGDQIPIYKETHALADAFAIDPLGMLSSGSLLCAVQPNAVDGVIAARDRVGVTATAIGEILDADSGFFITTPQGVRPLPEFARDEVSTALDKVI